MRSHAKASSVGSSTGRIAAARFAVLSLVALVGLMAFAAAGALAKPQVTEHYASFGPDGTESTDFERINGVAYDQQSAVVYVLDGKAGTLSKFDQDGTPLPFTGTAPYIEDGVIEGISVSVGGGFGGRLNESQVAVDSTSHVVYVTEEHSTRAFQADGEAAKFSAGPGKDTSEIPGFGRATGVCVDVNGAIYVSDESADTVSIFASSGALIKTFEAIRPGNVAVASGGALYVASTTGEEEEGVRKFTPSEFPVTTSTTYGASPPLEKTSGRFTVGVGVDPANGEAYVLETNLDDAWIKKFDSAGNLLRYFGGPEEEEERLGGYAQGVAVVAGGEEFQFYVGDTERGSYSKVAIYGEEITEGPPAIKSTSVIDVTADSATLRAQVNPNTAQTTYRFEYGPEDCAISACASVPLGGGLIPAGHVAVPVSQAIFSLDPATTYHYRIVAENSFDPPTEGPDRTFTTQVSGLGFQLSDSRAWEMVTPSDKHGSTLAGISAGHLQASAEGNGLAYLGRSPFEAEPEGNRGLEAMSTLARRGADGWHSKDITPPHEFAAGLATGNSSEYKMFSPDLSRAALDPRSTTLFSPEASERAPYLRENTEPATYTPLVTGKEGFANVPPGTEFGGLQSSAVGPVKVAGGTPDLSHVVVSSEVPLAAGAAIGALYEWVDGQLHPLSALPASEGGAIVAASSIGTNFKVVRNAISDDGSRVFWTASHLYMRDTVAEETTRLDLVQGGSGSGNAEPVYQGASADGSVAFFTDSQQLTDDASPEGRDLYRCELPLGGVPSECATLTDISAPAEGSGESAEVQGIASALSEDATKIYFVAKGALDPTPNSLGDVAVAKQPNLYIWQEGEGTRFIATLAKNDSNDWGSALGREKELNANGSPGGRYLSFMSERSLTGQDNLDAVSGKPVEQVFSYDAVADELLCISCNPSGALPHGERVGDLTQAVPVVDPWGLWENRFLAANLPQASAAALAGPVLYRPRAIFDNGRVFFHSFDALVPADSNGNWDVYEYEPTGVGDCTASSAGPSIARSGEGCVSLVSSGTAEGQSGFLDASESGNDVFFTTTAKLSVLDTDEERDIYDARVGGVVAKLTPRTECQGETCLPAPNPPNDPTPASASFRGAGNVASERCPASKRKVTRNGNSRCVSRKKQHKRKHRAAKRANSNHGRAAR